VAVGNFLLRLHANHSRRVCSRLNAHRLVTNGNRRGFSSLTGLPGTTLLTGRTSAELGNLHPLRLGTGFSTAAHRIATRVGVLRTAASLPTSSGLPASGLNLSASLLCLPASLCTSLLLPTSLLRLSAALRPSLLLGFLPTATAPALRKTRLLVVSLATRRPRILILLTSDLPLLRILVTRHFKIPNHPIFRFLFGGLRAAIQQCRVGQRTLGRATARRSRTLCARASRRLGRRRARGIRAPIHINKQGRADENAETPSNKR
jgi:hypothetical protein